MTINEIINKVEELFDEIEARDEIIKSQKNIISGLKSNIAFSTAYADIRPKEKKTKWQRIKNAIDDLLFEIIN